jgi:hypothetical protein
MITTDIRYPQIGDLVNGNRSKIAIPLVTENLRKDIPHTRGTLRQAFQAAMAKTQKTRSDQP